jgi:hypothetical protein
MLHNVVVWPVGCGAVVTAAFLRWNPAGHAAFTAALLAAMTAPDAASRKAAATGESHSITHSTARGTKTAPQRNSLQGRWFE